MEAPVPPRPAACFPKAAAAPLLPFPFGRGFVIVSAGKKGGLAMREFLPVSKADMCRRGWEQCDFVYVIGDAYVDHPSFGHAIISRVLEAAGYKVGILSQPDWKNPQSVTALGRPRLGFLVSGGNMDSMVNHYSVSKKRRKTDAFTPGGVMGKRPDYATVVYCNLIRRVYKDVPIVIGGIEASLRRLAHYDYWSDTAQAVHSAGQPGRICCSYGMGRALRCGGGRRAEQRPLHPADITFVDGTVYKARSPEFPVHASHDLPDYGTLCRSRRKYAESFYTQYCNTDPFSGRTAGGALWAGRLLCGSESRRPKPLSQQEMDRVYSLPIYADLASGSYEEGGGVPAIEEVQVQPGFSNRGCFGGCSFCALTFHQGRIIQTRGATNPLLIRGTADGTGSRISRGIIHDVGGPTANFRPACLPEADGKGRLPHAAVPVSQAMQESGGRPFRLSGAPAGAAPPAGSEKGVYPVGDPV